MDTNAVDLRSTLASQPAERTVSVYIQRRFVVDANLAVQATGPVQNQLSP